MKRQELIGMKPNHHSLKSKQEKEPNKKYKDLKQKAKIADWMFEKTCDYYREHNRMPEGGDMVFALERRKVGKKTKQCPVIRYR